MHLLPSYDEYLLGYKDRTDVLPKEYYSKAFTNNGLFYPIVLHEGQVIGNWDKSVKKRGSLIEHSWFRLDDCVDEGALDREKDKYIRFLAIIYEKNVYFYRCIIPYMQDIFRHELKMRRICCFRI